MSIELSDQHRSIQETARRFADQEIMPVARYFRDAKVATIYEGTSQIQLLLIGSHYLGMKAFAT